ncbi:MAG: 16S rRNA (adenine(1518)-N(6)/adenine(1519)-N(6))-dimethyltransferase RsmA [Planctomycetota bacterium]
MTKSAGRDGFQTQSELRARLEGAGLSPRKMFGQNFLIDRNLMTKLLDAAELTASDTVLEVGAGTGSLTAQLASRAGHVIAVEIDRGLIPLLTETTAGLGNVTLLHCDALERKSEVSALVLDDLRQPAGTLKLVANLPYDIATSLVINLLTGDIAFERFCFTVQTEVAARFLAKTDTSDYGPVSIVAQTLATGRRICKAPAEAFWPRPKVHSTMVALHRRTDSPIGATDAKAFAEFVRAFFQHRRQMIGKIARSLDNATRLEATFASLGIDPKLRPENLTPDQWAQLFLTSR